MWPRRSHALSTLTRMTPNKMKFEWKEVEQDAFDKIKQIVAHDTLSSYPNINRGLKFTPIIARSNYVRLLSIKEN